mgnify:CR=1 FL=1
MRRKQKAYIPIVINRAPLAAVPGLSWSETDERLCEAIRTLAALPDRERKWVYAKLSSWPEVLREAVDVMGLALERLRDGKISAYEALTEPRWLPTKEMIDRLDETLPWLTLLDERELKIVTLRAFRVSWLKISWRYGRSDTTVQRWHREAIERVRKTIAA